MTSQDSKDPTPKVFVRSNPTEPLEIGPSEYRNKVINLSQGIVSDIKNTIRPTTKPQVTSSKKPGHSSKDQSAKQTNPCEFYFTHQSPRPVTKQASDEDAPDVLKKAQEIISGIKYTVRPTVKPSPPPEIEDDAILGSDGTSSEDSDVLRGTGNQLDVKLSDRMEYLARPKKGTLYQAGFECPDGAIPEKHLPSWKFLPLHNKIPADRYPYEINMGKVPDEMFSTSSKDGMNLDDISDGGRDYNSLLDPDLQSYFGREGVRDHLVKSGQVTESGRIVCTLKELNDYRKYLARKQARAMQMRLRAEYEEEKRLKEEKRREEVAKREEEKEKRKTQTALRDQIKGTIKDAKQVDMMAAQTERDKKIINRRIKLQAQLNQRALEREEKFEKIRAQRGLDKGQQEKRKKEMKLEMAKKDLQRIEKISKRKEEQKLDRRRKLEEFWDRKAVIQSEWFEEGFELERKRLMNREENVKARKEQVWIPQGRDETSDDEETDSVRSEKGTPRKKTVTPTSSKEITLDQLLKKEIQSTASYETMKGNPSREEILTPVSSKEITLENILREETENRVSVQETSIKETASKEDESSVLGEETSRKETAPKEDESIVLVQKTSRKETAAKEDELSILGEETEPKESENRVSINEKYEVNEED